MVLLFFLILGKKTSFKKISSSVLGFKGDIDKFVEFTVLESSVRVFSNSLTFSKEFLFGDFIENSDKIISGILESFDGIKRFV